MDIYTAVGFNTIHLGYMPFVYLLSSDTKVKSVNTLSLLRILNMFCQPAHFEQPYAEETTFFLELSNGTDVLG